MNLHETHINYLLADVAADTNRIETLFAALDSFDVLERRWFIGMTSFAMGTQADPEFPTEEENEQARYDAFKERCIELMNSGIAEFMVVYAYVAMTLNTLRRQGCDEFAKDNEQFLSGAVEHFKAKLDTDDEEGKKALNKNIMMAEEALVNQTANVELYRERYNQFCDLVVKQLLGNAG